MTDKVYFLTLSSLADQLEFIHKRFDEMQAQAGAGFIQFRVMGLVIR